MTWTIDDLNKLKAAIATGARKVKYQDQEVEYRSINEMQRIQAAMEEELGVERCTHERFITSKGL